MIQQDSKHTSIDLYVTMATSFLVAVAALVLALLIIATQLLVRKQLVRSLRSGARHQRRGQIDDNHHVAVFKENGCQAASWK